MNLLTVINPHIKTSGDMIERIALVDELINGAAKGICYKVKEEYKGKGISLNQEYLDEGIFNLKLYYLVALIDPVNKHAVSENVDPFWHFHILFTRDYCNFCQKVFGSYVHHDPLMKNNHSAVAEITELYEYTLNVFQEIFIPGTITDKWWNKDSKICHHYESDNPKILKDASFKKRVGTQLFLVA